jgi:hypothetical protein
MEKGEGKRGEREINRIKIITLTSPKGMNFAELFVETVK